jgi:predicted transposase YbfD/YdcC
MALSALSIRRHFTSLEDPRRKHGQRHNLLDIIVIAVCGVIANCNDWQDIETFAIKRKDWFARFLALPNGIPSHDTIERVFARLEPLALQRCLLNWLKAITAALNLKHVAIDGKTARHSGSPTRGLGALQIVSAWAVEQDLTLGQVVVAEGSNEIPTIPTLLELIDLHGALVTIDAIGTQTDIASKIVKGGGDYVLTVKDNQPHLREDIEACFTAAIEDDFEGVQHDEYQSEEAGHGRQEKRWYTVIYEPEGIRGQDQWEGLKAIGMCYSERTVNGKTSEDLRYFIGSRKMSARRYGDALRGHWGIENSQHWRLDVIFREDDSRIQKRDAQANFAMLRKLALSLLKRHPAKESIKRKRLAAACDTTFLEKSSLQTIIWRSRDAYTLRRRGVQPTTSR